MKARERRPAETRRRATDRERNGSLRTKMKEMMKAVAYGRKEKVNFWVNVRVLFLYLFPLRAEASRCPYIQYVP